MEGKEEFSEQTIAKINEVIDIAYSHDGEIFGGYVRDVIVPRMKNPSCKVYFKDVDIWFTDKYQACLFVTEMNKKYDFRHHPLITINDEHYPFSRQQYHLYDDGKCSAWFDIIVSKEFPVDDFDVNFLSYHKGQIKSHHKDKSIIQLTEAIYCKEITITDEYYQKATKSRQLNDNKALRCSVRIQNKYLNKGWKIIYRDKMVSLEIAKRIGGILRSQRQFDCFDTYFSKYSQSLSILNNVTGLTNTSTNHNELSNIVGQNVVGSANSIVSSPNKSESESIRISSTPSKPLSDLSDLAKASEEYRQAAQTWNKKLAEHVTDKDILAKYTVQVAEPSIFELLLKK